MEADHGKKVSLKGLLVPADWDGSGRVTSLLLSTAQERDYVILDGPLLGRLLALIHTQVELEGWAWIQDERIGTIRVNSYRSLKPAPLDSASPLA